MLGRPTTPPDPIVLAQDSVTFIEDTASKELTDEAIESLQRNAQHLQIVIDTYSPNEEKKAEFEAAIQLANSLIN
jgi:hypothetical protein